MSNNENNTRLQVAFNEALPRMQAIQDFIYWNATQQDGAILTEGAFFPGGPVCLIATLPNGRSFSTIKASFIVKPFWVADRAEVL